MIFDSLAGSQFSYSYGTAGSVTVPAGCFVRHLRALGGSGATLTITPGGPNQSGSAGGAIPLPSAVDYFALDMLGELGPGSVLVFASTASYFVSFAKYKSGGP